MAVCDHTDIIATYRSTGSIRETARKHDVSPQTVRRVLITYGIPIDNQEMVDRITAMLMEMSAEDVASALNISVKTVRAYQPYSKGSYAVGAKSDNAIRIARCRQK